MSTASKASHERSLEFEASVCEGVQLWSEFRYSDRDGVLIYDNAAIYQTSDVGLMWVTWMTRYERRREEDKTSWNEFTSGEVTQRTPVSAFTVAFSWYLDWNPPPPRDRLTVEGAEHWTGLLQTFEAMDKLRGWP